MRIKAAVIGNPISHSLSPVIHNYFLNKNNIDGNYEAIRIEEHKFEESILKLVEENYKGFNITIPYKESIIKLCNNLSNTAKFIGAVNTVYVTEDKKLFGHNSDCDGFMNNLKKEIVSLDLNGKTAFVIGAGGASRAVIYSLIKEGVSQIKICNRSVDRVKKIIDDFKVISKANKCNIEYLDNKNFWINLKICDILINTTSLGMAEHKPLEFDLSKLKDDAIVCDIIYKPLETNLLIEAKKNGNKVVNGLGMLIEQALVGFEMWFKTKASYDKELYKILIDQYGRK